MELSVLPFSPSPGSFVLVVISLFAMVAIARVAQSEVYRRRSIEFLSRLLRVLKDGEIKSAFLGRVLPRRPTGNRGQFAADIELEAR